MLLLDDEIATAMLVAIFICLTASLLACLNTRECFIHFCKFESHIGSVNANVPTLVVTVLCTHTHRKYFTNYFGHNWRNPPNKWTKCRSLCKMCVEELASFSGFDQMLNQTENRLCFLSFFLLIRFSWVGHLIQSKRQFFCSSFLRKWFLFSLKFEKSVLFYGWKN